MAEYFDAQDRKWRIHLNVGTLRKIRREVSDADGKPLDLLDVARGYSLARLNADPCLLVEALWSIAEQRAKSLEISRADFEDAHRGDVLIDSLAALVEALADFFPKLEGRAIRCALRYLNQARQKAVQTVEETLALNPPETRDHSKTLNAPKAPNPPETLNPPEAPNPPKTLNPPEAPNPPETLSESETLNPPEAPNPPETRDHSKTLNAPKAPNPPKTLNESETLNHSETLNAPEAPNPPKTLSESESLTPTEPGESGT